MLSNSTVQRAFVLVSDSSGFVAVSFIPRYGSQFVDGENYFFLEWIMYLPFIKSP